MNCLQEMTGAAARAIDDGVPYCGIFIFFSLVVWVLELYIDLCHRRRLAKKKMPQELAKDFTVARGCYLS